MKLNKIRNLLLLGVISTLAAPLVAVGQTTVFQDTFGSSTLNPTAASPGTHNSSTTTYEIASSKNATTTTAAAGALTLSTSGTTSGYTEAQALFTATPVTLNAAGQYIELYYTFTDTANIFNGVANNAMQIVLGLYNSGSSAPTNGTALWNAGLLNTATTATNGACKGWAGYTAAFSYSSNTVQASAIGSRPAQTQANNSCQAIGYNSGFTGGANVTTMAGVVGQPLLTTGNQYTMHLRISYVNATTLAITNTLYNGAGIGGTVFSAGGWTGKFGVQAASSLTMTFDALQVGIRPNGGQPTTLQINSLTVAKYIPAAPTITGLTNQTIAAGENATLSATVGGTPTPALQWYVSTDGGTTSNTIPGETGSTLTLNGVQSSQNGYIYYIVANNSQGSATSSMTLTVTGSSSAPPTITGLVNQTVNARFNVTMAPIIGGSPTPARQWSVNGTPIPGATGATLTLTNVQLSQNGYVYSLTATNTSGVVTSNMVLTVTNALFNVQLNGLGTTYSGVGQIGSAGDVWNNPALANFDNSGTQHSPSAAIITSYGLTDSRGVASPVTLSMTGNNYKSYYGTSSGHGEVAGLNNQSLKFDWTGATPGPSASISLAGLPPNASLNLYAYGASYYTSPIGSIWTFAAANGGASAGQYGTNSMDLTQAANEGICWVKIVGTTDSGGNLTVNVTPQSAGVWWQTYLNGFQLQLHTAPLVTGLTNLTVIQGNSVTLTPTVSGTPAPSFQWQTNGVNIAGETSSSLALNNVQYSQNGYVYSLISSNQAGVATNSMTLTVIVTPSIVGLNNQTAMTNDTVTISPTVSGVPAPSLQWQFNGVNLTDGATGNGSTIAGSTSGTLTITGAQSGDSGSYSLIASNSAGSVTNSMTLTVAAGDVAPVITGLSNQTVVQSNNATFTASVIGLPAPALQWLDQTGAPITGATGSSLTLTNVAYAQNGYTYSLVASNSVGMVTNSATLTVLLPAYISAAPTNLTVVVGTPATFSVTAGGDPAVAYQWKRNGSPISGATSPSYTLSNSQGADNGVVFSVTVSNSVGTATGSATLTVLSTMTGTFLPTNGAVNISPDQQLRIVFSGGSPRLNTNGTFTVRDAADNSLVQTIDASQFLAYTPGNTSVQTIPNAAVRFTQGSYSGTGTGSTGYYYMPIALYGNEAWITLTNRLAYGHTYYATCDTGLFLDSNGASFSGIAGTNTWRLSTKAAGPATPTINGGPTSITVGQDGAGDFATFQGAFDWIPQSNTLARTVHVLPGIYRDSATLAGNRNFVTIVGDGASRTNAQLIYPFIYFAPPNPVFTAGSLRIESSDVTVVNLTVDNIIYGVYHPTGYATSGAAGAFAGAINTLATTGKRIVFDNVLIKGGQDTIFNITGIIYYHNCEVWGSVDFIYGAALGVFDQCSIVQIRSTGGPCTAPNTAYAQPYGLTFLNCTFPRALVANGYPYDVNAGSTTFQRAWGQDGMTTIFNCAVDNQISTAGWGTFGSGGENTCRAREYGTTMIGGGAAPTIAQRQAAGAYWLNTIDPDYTNNPSLSPTDPLLAPPTGTNNRVAVTVNPSDYTLSAIFGNSYFNLNGWLPAVLPTITTQPTNQAVSHGQPATFTVAATGLPSPSYQWLQNGAPITDATNATFAIASAVRTNGGNYSVVVNNGSGSVTSSVAVLTYNDTAPAAQTMTVTRQAGFSLKIFLSDLSTNWSDVDGDLVSLTGINWTSRNGVTLTPMNVTTNLDGSYVITNTAFLGYFNSNNVADRFSYTIADGFGGTATGYVNILVSTNSVFGQSNPQITSINGGLQVQVTFYGVPGYTYIVQRNLVDVGTQAAWLDFSTNAATTSNPAIIITDVAYPQAFYRLKWQP